MKERKCKLSKTKQKRSGGNFTSVSCWNSKVSGPEPRRVLRILCFSLSHSFCILSHWCRSTSANVCAQSFSLISSSTIIFPSEKSQKMPAVSLNYILNHYINSSITKSSPTTIFTKCIHGLHFVARIHKMRLLLYTLYHVRAIKNKQITNVLLKMWYT